MRNSEYVAFLPRAWKGRRLVLVKGKPGVGKTYGARQAAEIEGMDFLSLCTPLLSPVKVGGYPIAPKEPDAPASHALFSNIHRAFNARKPTVLCWDDLGMGTGETTKCIIEMIQFGEIDGKKLPDCVVQMACTNDVGHGADVQGLIEPLKTRFHTIIEVETNLEDIVSYGLSRNWPADLCAFLRNTPDALHDWKPSKSIMVDGACPRGWEYCAEWINLGIEDPEVIAGCVGKGRATQYLAFRGLINELPDVDACLLDPEGSPVPKKPDALFLIAMALAAKMTAGNFGACVKYLNRCPAMNRAFAIRDAFRAEQARKRDNKLPKGWTSLASSRDFTAWACSDDGKNVMAAAS